MILSQEQFNSFTPNQFRGLSAGHVATAKDVKVTYQRRKNPEELKADIEKLHYEATHDPLTGALNRRGLKEFLQTAKRPLAVLKTDGTNFKAVNDKYGDERGDEVIKGNYIILKKSIRPTDVIARPGGDDFVIILNGEEQVESSAEPLNVDEERRHDTPSVTGLIDITKARIAEATQTLLDTNPELKAVNFNIAVGGAVVQEGESISESFLKAEQAMKTHKGLQHEEGGSYR